MMPMIIAVNHNKTFKSEKAFGGHLKKLNARFQNKIQIVVPTAGFKKLKVVLIIKEKKCFLPWTLFRGTIY